MYKKIFLLAITFLLSIICSPSFAEDTNQTDLSLSKILLNLQQEGYTPIDQIELKNNLYQLKVLDSKAEEVTILVDRQTGKIVKPGRVLPLLTLTEAAEKIEQNGYHTIYILKFEGGKYKANALDKNNKKVTLDVDAKTGTVSLQFFLGNSKK